LVYSLYKRQSYCFLRAWLATCSRRRASKRRLSHEINHSGSEHFGRFLWSMWYVSYLLCFHVIIFGWTNFPLSLHVYLLHPSSRCSSGIHPTFPSTLHHLCSLSCSLLGLLRVLLGFQVVEESRAKSPWGRKQGFLSLSYLGCLKFRAKLTSYVTWLLGLGSSKDRPTLPVTHYEVAFVEVICFSFTSFSF